jgi:hypothetical protein
MSEELLVRAVQHLEAAGKAALFRGDAVDDTGIKFF